MLLDGLVVHAAAGSTAASGRPDLWVELYRHDTQSSIDSCRCRDFEEVQNFGGDLIAQARLLFKSSEHVTRR
jgi:hypothetical protein